MKLSTKGRYGLRAVLDLAVNYGQGQVSIRAIADRQKISEYYLEQLFKKLRKAGIVQSIRGAHGGYVLNRSPDEITAYEIIRILGETIEISECIEATTCSNIDSCATRPLWIRIKQSIDAVLKTTTLQDMVDDYKKITISKDGGQDE